MIKAALQRETVAENPRCQALCRDLDDCRNRQTYSRRDVWGCSRDQREKNGSTTSNKKTATTRTSDPCVRVDNPALGVKKPLGASALGVRTKMHQEPLDSEGSFRDVANL
jgi:hypothetical protein